MTHTLQYGTTTIEYDLSFTERRTLGITVHPDLTVTVVAPSGSSLDAVERKLKNRASWIVKRQQEFEQYLPHIPPRQYLSGETHLYLGKQYRLKVIEDPVKAVKLTRGRFFIHTPAKTDRATLKQQLDDWYRARASQVFDEQLAACMKRVTFVGITETPPLHIKTMQKRWGSCTSAGAILLNLKLIQVPKPLIDYLIIHELCHLKVHNHSRAFYDLLDKVLPDWPERRERLNRVKVG